MTSSGKSSSAKSENSSTAKSSSSKSSPGKSSAGKSSSGKSSAAKSSSAKSDYSAVPTTTESAIASDMASAITSNKMDRGRGSEELISCMEGIDNMEIRQTRRGWCQEILGCEAKNEFKYYINGEKVFESLEDTDCFCRVCCNPCHPFKTEVKQLESDAEIMTIDRPLKCAMSSCKCCCYQEATFSSDKKKIGSIKETCFYCIPTFAVFDSDDEPLYVVRPPTCCGGLCINCCAEGNPCGKGCCKVSFRFYKPDQPNNGDAEYEGHILSKPKSLATEIFTDANAFDVAFPDGASAAVKGIFMGTTLFLNAVFFEGQED